MLVQPDNTETPTITQLRERIRALEQSLSDRSRELEVYQAVQLAINRQLELQNVLQMIADQARLLTHSAGSTVYLMETQDPSFPTIRLAVLSGELGSDIQPGYQMPLNESVAGLAIRDRKPYCVQDALHDPRVFVDAVQRSSVRSFLIVPLISGEQPIGIISVANKLEGPFTPEDERIMSLLASSVVISLENARLYAQAGELAVANERNRLARELHDAVTQNLFSASLIGDVLPTLWEEDPTEGRIQLTELRRLTRGALAEMRTLLLELRPAALENARLVELIPQLANAFTGRTQIPVQLHIENHHEAVNALPMQVKIAVYRIAQEALNNIARHAEAEHVQLDLCATRSELSLTISDDGQGFEHGEQTGGHFGLANMQDRAQSVGAAIEICSQSGVGTRIKFFWTPEGVNPYENR